jgi:hypothetical protein
MSALATLPVRANLEDPADLVDRRAPAAREGLEDRPDLAPRWFRQFLLRPPFPLRPGNLLLRPPRRLPVIPRHPANRLPPQFQDCRRGPASRARFPVLLQQMLCQESC